MWATCVGGVGVGAIALGSARGCVSDGAQMHASGRGMGLEVRVPLGLSFGLVRRAEWLPLRRVVVLVSAVRRVWLRKVFSVRTSGTYVVLSCHRFLLHCVTLFPTFTCFQGVFGVFRYCPSFVRDSRSLLERRYDPKEASRLSAGRCYAI